MKTLFALLTLLLCTPAAAQTNTFESRKVEQIGTFDDWSAFIFTDAKEKVCYISTRPVRSRGEYTRRGDVFLMVSHRPYENLFDVVTLVSGYMYMPRTDAQIKIGDYKASLFTNDDTAWARNLRTDSEIVRALDAGTRVTVEGTSIEGVRTHDTFSLKGFKDAVSAVNRLCRQPAGAQE